MPKHIQWDLAATAGENARAQLPSLAGGYFKAGREALEAARSPAELHAFRLRTKRLRYTLELFRGSYGPSLEQRIDSLKEVQTVLGDINDCAVALRVAKKLLASHSAHYRKVERFLNARVTRLAAGFRKHWREEFDAPGREDWWVGYLARRRG